jgi:hypothetical protein
MQLSEFTEENSHFNLTVVRLSRKGNQIIQGDFLDYYDDVTIGGGYAWPVYVYLVVDPSGEILDESYERGEEYMY